MKIAIFGAGAWGTALAISLSKNHTILMWDRVDAVVDETQKTRENKVGLPGFILPESISLTKDFDKVLAFGAGEDALAIVATSVAGLRGVAQRVSQSAIQNLIWVCKGFEENTALLPSQVVSDCINRPINIGVLSGPSFAQEVAQRLPCALTIASKSESLQKLVVSAMNVGTMRIYSSSDVVGVEIGGAVKNILAIATGIADGLQLGANARAALVTRGLAEMTRLGVALGGRPETFMGLTGMGDLILTCTGDLSRNRRVGLGLAKGKTLDHIVNELGHVAEGVKCAQTVCEIATRNNIDMPIAKAVSDILFKQVSAKDTVSQLLSRHARAEMETFHKGK